MVMTARGRMQFHRSIRYRMAVGIAQYTAPGRGRSLHSSTHDDEKKKKEKTETTRSGPHSQKV
jgi:hypothetical protein